MKAKLSMALVRECRDSADRSDGQGKSELSQRVGCSSGDVLELRVRHM